MVCTRKNRALIRTFYSKQKSAIKMMKKSIKLMNTSRTSMDKVLFEFKSIDLNPIAVYDGCNDVISKSAGVIAKLNPPVLLKLDEETKKLLKTCKSFVSLFDTNQNNFVQRNSKRQRIA